MPTRPVSHQTRRMSTENLPPVYGERPGQQRRTIAIVLGTIATTAALAVGAFFLLVAFLGDDLVDEWHCSDGEAPAGEAPFYNHCFREGADLPAGYTWDPYGNRPMSYNCDKSGWKKVTRPPTDPQSASREDDCLREDTPLPAGWSLREDD